MSEIVFNPSSSGQSFDIDLQSQVQNLQTTLASLNQQVIILQETLQERDQEIANLQNRLSQCKQDAVSVSDAGERSGKIDDTLTIVGALINLYKSVFLPGKAT